MVTYVDGRMVNSTSDGNFECIVVWLLPLHLLQLKITSEVKQTLGVHTNT